MIHHLSIAARDPKHVAEVLAELMGGGATPFPITTGAWFASQRDAYGTGVEVYPAGTEMHPTEASGSGFKTGEARAYGPTHFALSVDMSPEEVTAIAEREGWQCQRLQRGNGGFHVMEVWIENSGMIEVLPPAFAAEYLALTRNSGPRPQAAE